MEISDSKILILAIALWCPVGWVLFKKWFGNPKRFLKSAKKARGSEAHKLLEKGFASALEGQAFEFAVGIFIGINVLLVLAIAAILNTLQSTVASL